MKYWPVSEKNFKRLEKLRPYGRQKNVVIHYLLQIAKEKGVTSETVKDEVVGL